jgi:hypothetical protein
MVSVVTLLVRLIELINSQSGNGISRTIAMVFEEFWHCGIQLQGLPVIVRARRSLSFNSFCREVGSEMQGPRM